MSVRSVSRSHSAWFVAAFAVAATLLAEPCSAQPPDGHIESSRALYRQAHEEMAQQKWAEARRLLLEIWGEARTHDVAASLGQVEDRLGDPAAGAHYMALAVALVPPREKLETVQRYRAALAELKQKVATVHVTVTAADAELRVDGEPVEPTADSELFLAPGEHTLEARKGTAHVASEPTRVVAGRRYEVTLELPSDGSSAQHQSAASPSRQPRDNGAQAASSENNGRFGARADARHDTPSRIPAMAAGAVGTVGLIAGVGFLISSLDKTSDRDRRLDALSGASPCGFGSPHPAECQDIKDLAEEATAHRNLALAGFGLAVVGGAAAYLLWPRSEATQVSLSFGPSLSGLGAQTRISGAF